MTMMKTVLEARALVLMCSWLEAATPTRARHFFTDNCRESHLSVISKNTVYVIPGGRVEKSVLLCYDVPHTYILKNFST